MTTPLTAYTSYDEVRAVLGVSSDDLEDATIALPIYANDLEDEMEEIDPDLPATFATVSGLSVHTVAQARFLRACNGFATYAVARKLTGSMSMFAAKQVTDSKAGLTRFDNPLQIVLQTIQREYERAKTRLGQAVAALSSSTRDVAPRPYLSAATPGYDPVTNT